MGDKVIERAVLLQQLGGGLLADTLDAFDVVHAVADETLEVHDLLGGDAPVGHQGRSIQVRLLAQVEHLHVVADELPAILVRGAKGDFNSTGSGGGGNGRHDVVGLVAGQR